MGETPEVTVGVATVYHYGRRRYLTKRAAFAAKALDILRGGEHGVDVPREPTDPACECLACLDERNASGHHAALTRALMRGEPLPAFVTEGRADA